MGSPVHYACYGKEMLGWIREKMAIPKSAPKGGRFFDFGLITAGNSALACSDSCAPGGDCSTVAGNSSWDNAHTSNPSSKGKRLGRERNTLLQRAQHTSGSSNG